MFAELEKINARPKPFEFYTASDLWTDEHTSQQMLHYHLDMSGDAASRNATFIDRSVEWIASHFGVVSGTKIADFGCGPGLYANSLARRQADVIGIDFSKRSIQYAQSIAAGEGLSTQYMNRNYLEFTTDRRFDLILMIMCDFCALSPLQRAIMLRKFRAMLAPGGAVLLDAYSLKAFEQREETSKYEINLLNGFWSPHKYHGFLNVFKYESEKVVLDKYTIVEADRTRIVYNWLQYFEPDALESEFAENGLRIEQLWSDVAGTTFNAGASEFAVVARRQ